MSTARRLLLLIIVIGLLDSGYLTYVHYTNLVPYCPDGGVVNCEQVVTSSFSTVAGIPIALGGVVWFVVLAFLVFAVPKHDRILRDIWAILGVGAVCYSIVGQVILGKLCPYCTLLDVLLILSGYYLLIKHGKDPIIK